MAIKRIDIKEFRGRGYLQELNRRFLHPLGLALETIIDDDTGEEVLGGVWDYRDDPEGMYFGVPTLDDKFILKAELIEVEMEAKIKTRSENLGYFIQPVPSK